ncbi:MAG: hypothetical protein JWL72_4479 [Ilumatobacteraceae bacterium]|nr:hypothetical protein [Ilumatobacteraceae bacterium]MCU1391141.1 hypothetical protein [Ilumatobacteraceae bacterium]
MDLLDQIDTAHSWPCRQAFQQAAQSQGVASGRSAKGVPAIRESQQLSRQPQDRHLKCACSGWRFPPHSGHSEKVPKRSHRAFVEEGDASTVD